MDGWIDDANSSPTTLFLGMNRILPKYIMTGSNSQSRTDRYSHHDYDRWRGVDDRLHQRTKVSSDDQLHQLHLQYLATTYLKTLRSIGAQPKKHLPTKLFSRDFCYRARVLTGVT